MLKPLTTLLFLFTFVAFAADIPAQTPSLTPTPKATTVTGKDPIIIIPGISGSELINPKTGKKVWFSVKRDKDDDIRLPMSSPVFTSDRDNLRVGDIIREVKLPVLPDVEVYQTLIDALIERGYSEGDWKHPKATDVFYIFAYDWRRDNVESAQLLMQRMLSVKRALRKPNLKFNILAHSMGGLIARYAAMYGSADLPRNGAAPVPTWAGASHINKLMMFGTPNEGAFSSFDALINGYPIVADRKLPFIDDLRPEDVISSPAAFQLLPHEGSARFLDENLQPIQIDIYDPANWTKYGWGAIGDPKFLAKLKDGDKSDLNKKERKKIDDPKRQYYDDVLLSHTTIAQVRAFFAAALLRAKRFNLALDAPTKNVPVQLYTYGGNCEPTLNAVVLLHDEKKNEWTTLVDARDIKNSGGKTLKKDEVKAAMFAIGDGRVTASSLLPVNGTDKDGNGSPLTAIFPVASSFFGCSSHFKLFLDKPIQDSFLSALVVEKQKQP
ncbi:MAG: hypothetical protein ABJB40_04865 [Acidobacteriota bacterium]